MGDVKRLGARLGSSCGTCGSGTAKRRLSFHRGPHLASPLRLVVSGLGLRQRRQRVLVRRLPGERLGLGLHVV